ncbi:30S ribosomal protein S17 [Candidatus Micrarchaeota archaeon]|nr:30S ribosomal protein S17 [Candidatus Micrarchaeota archaeon]
MAGKKESDPGLEGLSIRGETLVGRVISAKAKKTAVVERDTNKYFSKYGKWARARSRIQVHNPESINAKVGDRVKIAETRKLSKTKSWTIVGFVEKGESS